MGVDPIAPPLQTGLEGFDAAVEIVALEPDVAQPEPGVLELRMLLHELGVETLGVLEFASTLGDQRQIPHRGVEAGGELKGALMLFACGGEIALLLQDRAQIGVRGARVRPDFDGLSVGLGRGLELAQLVRGDTQVEPSFKRTGRELDQLRAMLEGRFKICLSEGGMGQSFERGRGARQQLGQMLGELLDGGVVLARDGGGDHVPQQLFRIRIAGEQLSIRGVGLIGPAGEVERHGFSELRGVEIGLGLEALLEALERLFGGAGLQLADGPSEARLDALGIDVESFLKRVGGVVPALEPLQADTLIIGGGLMFRIGLGRFLIALGGVGEFLELELDVAQGRVQLGRTLAAGDRRGQLLEGELGLAFEMKRDRFPQRFGGGRCLGRAGGNDVEPQTL